MQDHNANNEDEFDETLILSTNQKGDLETAIEATAFHLTLFLSVLVNFIYVHFFQQTAVSHSLICS